MFWFTKYNINEFIITADDSDDEVSSSDDGSVISYESSSSAANIARCVMGLCTEKLCIVWELQILTHIYHQLQLFHAEIKHYKHVINMMFVSFGYTKNKFFWYSLWGAEVLSDLHGSYFGFFFTPSSMKVSERFD